MRSVSAAAFHLPWQSAKATYHAKSVTTDGRTDRQPRDEARSVVYTSTPKSDDSVNGLAVKFAFCIIVSGCVE